MARASTTPAWQVSLIVLTGTVVGIVVLAVLYWAQAVCIPIAMAGFLTFLLAPLVTTLRRYGLGRVPSVLLVVFAAVLVLAATVWVVGAQAASLANEMPKYTQNITEKIKSLRKMGEGPGAERLERMIAEIAGAWGSPSSRAEAALSDRTPRAKPPQVVVQPETPGWLAVLPALLARLAETAAGLGMAVVLLIFMLLNREDLRNRLIRLIGRNRITATTKAIDDAARRISRFLLMQLIINGSYGLILALGLLAIGVPYAFLWGFLGFMFRYIPYVGPWIAALSPIVISLAMSQGWMQPLLVIGLILVLELITNNLAEPHLYGQSIGVSAVALLVAAAFWAFLWGPIGLILSSPLTVCLMVLGKYVPQLAFLEVLLGDKPTLAPDVTYYQRLLARDQDEATELVLAQLRTSPADQIYDDLLIPALSYARRDRERDDLIESDERFLLQATWEILEDLSERREKSEMPGGDTTSAVGAPRIRILACPARDETDRAALAMLKALLDPAKWEMEIAAVETLTAEFLARVAERSAPLVCIGALPPGGLAHTRYLCKRLRARFPEIKIVVGRWGLKGNVDTNRQHLDEAGADLTATTLLETRGQLASLMPVLAEQQRSHPARADRLQPT